MAAADPTVSVCKFCAVHYNCCLTSSDIKIAFDVKGNTKEGNDLMGECVGFRAFDMDDDGPSRSKSQSGEQRLNTQAELANLRDG